MSVNAEVPTESLPPTRWGVGQVLLAALLVTLIGFVGASLVAGATGYADVEFEELPLWVLAIGQVPLSVGYVVAAMVLTGGWGRRLIGALDIRFRWVDVPVGLGVGVLAQVAVNLLYLPVVWFTELDPSEAARDLADRTGGGGTVVLLVLMVGIVAPVVEEIFYRGVALRAGAPVRSLRWRIVFSSLLFGAVHFQPLQFAALVLLAVVLAVLASRSGRLGPAIMTHVAFNMTTVVYLVG